jgi:hypothetical protein
MARTTDNVIREKVRLMERVPHQWQKHEAWDQIRVNLSARKPNRILAIAACLTLLLVISHQDQRTVKTSKTVTASAAVKKGMDVPIPKTIDRNESKPDVLPGKEIAKGTEPEPATESTAQNIEEQAQGEPVEEVTLPTVEVALPTIASEAPNAATPAVMPVLGVIPQKEQQSWTTVRKKGRFKFLRFNNHETFPEIIQDSKLIVARIR